MFKSDHVTRFPSTVVVSNRAGWFGGAGTVIRAVALATALMRQLQYVDYVKNSYFRKSGGKSFLKLQG
jgi:hypothetical protein